MNDEKWIAWKLQTSKTWEDMKDVLALTKIDFIDYDHKILVEYAIKLNILLHQFDLDFSLELVHEINLLLNNLYDYAVEHFKREEDFMAAYKLPGINQHLMEHGRILRMIREAIDDYEKGKVTVSHDLKIQVMEWLINHINKIDYEFFDLKHWQDNLIAADNWDAIKDIICLTGVNEVDRQHKDITVSVLNLFKLNVEEMSIRQLEEVFSEFSSLVKDHFDFEESFMIRYGIEDIHHNLDEHIYFINRLKKFPSEIFNQKSSMVDVKVWIISWWINHINVVDHDTFTSDGWMIHAIETSKNVDDMIELLRLTHVDNIDHDHTVFVELTFKLNTLINDEADKSEILSLLEKMYHVAESHFKREEAVMIKHDLKDYASHLSEHHMILDRLNEIIKNFREERLFASRNIKTMILDWWIHHTNTVDYRTFVINLNDDLMQKIREEEAIG